MGGHYVPRGRRDRRGAMSPEERAKWDRKWQEKGRELGMLPAPESPPEEASARICPEREAEILLALWTTLQPGDRFRPAGGAEQIIRRKSRYSVTTTNGVRWTAGEVLKVRNDRMRRLIDGAAPPVERGEMHFNAELQAKLGSWPWLPALFSGSWGDEAAVAACPHPLRLLYQYNNRFAKIGCPDCHVWCVVPQGGQSDTTEADAALLARVTELS